MPFDNMDARFMRLAFLGLVIIAPIAATLGVQVITHRLAFFSDAVGHSAFTGVALGILFSISPHVTMPLFGVLIGLLIVLLQRRGHLSSDTAIGVVFSFVVAFGLAIVSRERNLARDLQRFLYGDVLTISETDIIGLFVLLVAVTIFQFFSYNKLLYIGLNPLLAKTHAVSVARYQYGLALFISLVVMLAVWAVGVLLVTALLIVPAAAARNFSRSGGSIFWWAIVISLISAVLGLLISAEPWARTATGATVVLCACCCFLISLPFARRRKERV